MFKKRDSVFSVFSVANLVVLVIACASIALSSARYPTAQSPPVPVPGQPGKDVVWVPTHQAVVEKMLDMAGVTSDDVVMDLGSGDGRNVIAAARRGARAIGVEYNPDLVALSRRLAAEAGVSDRATFVQGDMYQADVSQATVLALFLTPETLDRMQDKFLAMKPGSRIVLNTFPVTDWEPDLTEALPAPCKAYCTAMLMIVPARADGKWRTDNVEMNLVQDFQFVRGTIGTQKVAGRLSGDRITLEAGDTQYSGLVKGNRIEGHVTVRGKQTAWSATRR